MGIALNTFYELSNDGDDITKIGERIQDHDYDMALILIGKCNKLDCAKANECEDRFDFSKGGCTKCDKKLISINQLKKCADELRKEQQKEWEELYDMFGGE